MAKPTNIILAGFGGQGVLFSGKLVAYAALSDGKEVSWLPSYGPEMRGGTANCSVVIADKPVGSPLVTTPDILIAMNMPSFEKFIDSVVPGGIVIYDSTLITIKNPRPDLKLCPVPATDLAVTEDLAGLSNLILMGKLFHEIRFVSSEGIEKGLNKCIPKSKAHLLEPNRRAMALGATI